MCRLGNRLNSGSPFGAPSGPTWGFSLTASRGRFGRGTRSTMASLQEFIGKGGSRRFGACAISTACLLVLALPVGANAKPGYKVHPAGIELTLPLELRAGKVIAVVADCREQRVIFAVEGRCSKIEYSLRGRVSSRQLRLISAPLAGST